MLLLSVSPWLPSLCLYYSNGCAAALKWSGAVRRRSTTALLPSCSLRADAVQDLPLGGEGSRTMSLRLPSDEFQSDLFGCCLRLTLLASLAFGRWAWCVARLIHIEGNRGRDCREPRSGRVIVHVAKDDLILFATIDHPVEAGSPPPRLCRSITHTSAFCSALRSGANLPIPSRSAWTEITVCW